MTWWMTAAWTEKSIWSVLPVLQPKTLECSRIFGCNWDNILWSHKFTKNKLWYFRRFNVINLFIYSQKFLSLFPPNFLVFSSPICDLNILVFSYKKVNLFYLKKKKYALKCCCSCWWRNLTMVAASASTPLIRLAQDQIWPEIISQIQIPSPSATERFPVHPSMSLCGLKWSTAFMAAIIVLPVVFYGVHLLPVTSSVLLNSDWRCGSKIIICWTKQSTKH